jgi:anti-sigma factor RsiW
MEVTNDRNICPREEIAAYLDGELSRSALDDFEAHVAQCATCDDELRTQRQLLCTLDAAFSSSARMALPENFTRVVAAHAENDLRGLRQKSERHRALQLAAVLAIAAFALLGAASSALVFQPARARMQIVARLLDLFWQVIAQTAEGAAIIIRMIGRATIDRPHAIVVFLALIFIVAISLLPRLIAKYHRTQIIE